MSNTESSRVSEVVKKALQQLINKEKAMLRISSSSNMYIRYKRALNEVEKYPHALRALKDIKQVKYIGKSLIEHISKEILSIKEIDKEEYRIIREEAKEIQQDKDSQKKNLFNEVYKRTEVSVKIKTTKKSRKRIFKVSSNGEQKKIPMPFSDVHLLLSVIYNEELSNCTIAEEFSLSYLKHRCIEYIKDKEDLFGSSIFLECADRRIKGILDTLRRAGLIESQQASQITKEGKEAIILLEKAFLIDKANASTESKVKIEKELDIKQQKKKKKEKHIDIDHLQSYNINTQKEKIKNNNISGPVLLIDNRERKGKENQFFFAGMMNRLQVPVESRMLLAGDFIWTDTVDAQELFCNLVVERKTFRDLIHSLRDGRYREQKKRLLSLPGTKVYLVEGRIPKDPPHLLKTFFSCILSTVQGGFFALHSSCIEESLYLLLLLHRYIQSSHLLMKKERLSRLLPTLQKKGIEGLTQEERMAVCLNAIHGVSYSTGLCISKIYKTLANLIICIKKEAAVDTLANIYQPSKEKPLGRKKAHKIISILGIQNQ